MSVKELKERIISRIMTIEDADVIQHVYDLLEAETGNMAEKNYDLTPEQMQIVEEARAQYRRGEYTTQEDLDKEMDEWLEK